MKVGIIGCGGIAWVHARAVMKQPAARIVGVADLDADRAQALAAAFGAAGIYTEARSLLSEQRPDVVHVLTPPHLHVPLAEMAIAQGCHVLVEKPLAPSGAETARLFQAADDCGVLVTVDHCMLEEDVMRRAIELARGGALGSLISVDARLSHDLRRSPDVVERGAENCHWSYQLNGGLLQDLMPHPASLVMELLPEVTRVVSIASHRGKLPPPWCDEIRVLVASGAVLGSISLSLGEHPDGVALTIRGRGGVLQADTFGNTLTFRRRTRLPRAIARGLSAPGLAMQSIAASVGNTWAIATGRLKADSTERIIRGFYAAIQGRGRVPVARENALRVAALIDAVWPSAPPRLSAAGSRRSDLPRRRAEVLVTGASGFIGTHLVERLVAEGIGVRALVRPNSPHRGRLREYPVEVADGDLADAQAVDAAARGVRLVCHAGATIGGRWEDHAKGTVAGTQNLIAASLTHGVQHLVHLSTLNVYELASLPDHAVVREESPFHRRPDRMGDYARAKIDAERLLGEARDTRGLPVTILRPGMVIGPMSMRTVFFPHLGYRHQDKLFVVFGRGDTVLPLTYIDNTVDAIFRALYQETAIGRSYNIVDDGAVTVRDYLERFVEVAGPWSRIIYVPYAVPYAVAAGLECAQALRLIREAPTSRAQVRQKHLSIRFDCTKAKAELGWGQVVPLEGGITRTFEWYVQRYG